MAVALPHPGAFPLARLAWPAAIALCACSALLPLWAGTLLPYQDAPVHLASVRVLADYRTPAYGFTRWFVIDLLRLQYLGFYLPAAGLAKLFGPDVACRIMLSLIGLATTAAFAFLLATFRRDLRLALFAPILFHTAPLYLGFFNFLESIPLALVVVALLERQLGDPRTGRGLALASCASLLLWLHPSALAWALGASLVLALTAGVPRAFPRMALPLAPAAALLCAWALQALASRDGEGRAAHARPRWQDLRTQLLDLFRYGNVLAGHADELCMAALTLIFLALALQRNKPWPGRGHRLPLVALATLCAYLVMPYDVGFIGFIHLRALPFLFFCAVAALPVAQTRASNVLFAALAALCVLYSALLCRSYRAFDAEAQAGQLEEVLQQAGRGRALTAVIHQQGSQVMQFQSYLHFGAYYQVLRGGRARYNFGETPWTPVRMRKENAPPPMPRGWELFPERFVPRRDLGDDDYLLVRGPGPAPGKGFDLRARAGRWQLYEARR